MPTPIAPIVNAAETITDAYIAAGSTYDMLALFAALSVGLGLATWLYNKARRAVRR